MKFFPTRQALSQVLIIALPIIGGMISQNVLNLVDTAMVGSLGDAALAATGMGSFINYLAIAFVLGLSSGVQAMAARRKGEGLLHETAIPLNGGLFLAVVLGIPMSLVFIVLAPSIFDFLITDQNVVSLGSSYLQLRLVGMVGVGMNFAFRGYWSAMEQTKFYLLTLIVMHALNIFLNWVLIFGNLNFNAMGVDGAGLATTISIYVGTLIYFSFGLINARQNGFFVRLPTIKTMKNLSKVSIPAGLQQLFFAGGMVTLFWIIEKIGTQELAAANVLMNITLAGLLPIFGLGLAAATLVGQSLGKKNHILAKTWGWQIAGLALIFSILMAIPVMVFHQEILGVFIKNPNTLSLATIPLLLTALFIGFDAFGTVLMQAHLGAGDAKRVMLLSFTMQWVVFLPVAFLVGPLFGFGLLGVWIAQTAYRFIQGVMLILFWSDGKWSKVVV